MKSNIDSNSFFACWAFLLLQMANDIESNPGPWPTNLQAAEFMKRVVTGTVTPRVTTIPPLKWGKYMYDKQYYGFSFLNYERSYTVGQD